MKGALDALHGSPLAREMLARLLDRGTLPHALCFAGPVGVGKRTVALALARALVCGKEASAACGCNACQKIQKGIHPDVRTFAADGATLKIDQVRALLSMVRLRPYEAPVKLFILDDADSMTDEAQNALLKTLEEPPPETYLVLTTSRPDALLPTIRSRCRLVRFQPLPRTEVEAILRERGVAADEAARRALHSGGSVGTALSLDLEAAEARRRRVLEAMKALAKDAPAATLFGMAKAESADRDELCATLEFWKGMARDVALAARGADARTLANPDLVRDLVPLARRLAPAALLALYREADGTRSAIFRNVAKQVAVEVMLLRARALLAGGMS